MANVSSNVIWDIVCRTDSFAVRSHGTVLSRDPRNVAGQHNFVSSGFGQKAICGITLHRKTKSAPAHMTISTSLKASEPLSMSRKTGFAQIIAATAARPDLRQAALARYSALLRSTGVHPDIKTSNKEAGRALRQRRARAEAPMPALDADA